MASGLSYDGLYQGYEALSKERTVGYRSGGWRSISIGQGEARLSPVVGDGRQDHGPQPARGRRGRAGSPTPWCALRNAYDRGGRSVAPVRRPRRRRSATTAGSLDGGRRRSIGGTSDGLFSSSEARRDDVARCKRAISRRRAIQGPGWRRRTDFRLTEVAKAAPGKPAAECRLAGGRRRPRQWTRTKPFIVYFDWDRFSTSNRLDSRQVIGLTMIRVGGWPTSSESADFSGDRPRRSL